MNTAFNLIEESQAILPKSKPKYWHIAMLDCSLFHDELGFFLELKKIFKFPSYFGNNLDAVQDCLTDLEWIKKTNIILIIQNSEKLIAEASGKELMEHFLSILSDTMILWNQKGNEGYLPKKFYTYIYQNDSMESMLKNLNYKTVQQTQLPIQRM